MKKGSKAYSIVNAKCPECQEGDFFEGKRYQAKVKDRCEVCDLKYAKETGFYQGSYYVAYGLGIFVIVVLWTASVLIFPKAEASLYLGIVITGIIILTPLMYPTSKLIWANMFMRYKPDKLKLKRK